MRGKMYRWIAIQRISQIVMVLLAKPSGGLRPSVSAPLAPNWIRELVLFPPEETQEPQSKTASNPRISGRA